jgi:uncharacterized membrane protein
MSIDVTPAPPHVPSPIRLVATDRPWTWLAAGWRDLMAAPHVGFTYGAALTACGWALVLLPTAGFFLVAPLLAAGLYEASRRRERGEAVTLAVCVRGFTRNASQLALMGVVLLLLHLFWVRVAALIFGLFFGLGFSPPLEQLPLAMLRSDALLPFLVVGTGVGAAFAAVAFAVSAVSIPMLVDRDVTAIEAVLVSLRAVAANPSAMAFWAGLIVVFTAMALVPFFLGLAFVLPLIGHATWHAYRDLVR